MSKGGEETAEQRSKRIAAELIREEEREQVCVCVCMCVYVYVCVCVCVCVVTTQFTCFTGTKVPILTLRARAGEEATGGEGERGQGSVKASVFVLLYQ